MPKFYPLRSGQNTVLPVGSAPAHAWQALVNGVVISDGIVPLRSLLRPVGTPISINAVTYPSVQGLSVYTPSMSSCVVSLFSGNPTGRSCIIQNIVNDFLVDNHLLPAIQFGVGTSVTATIPTASDGVIVPRNVADSLLQRAITYRQETLSTSLLSWGKDVASIYRETSAIGQPFPVSTLYRLGTTNGLLLDTRATAGYIAPRTPFVVTLDEYVCTVAGHPQTDPIALPAATAADVNSNRYYFRWSSPDTVDEWTPDLVTNPPQWTSGFLLLPNLGDVRDVVVAMGKIFVFQEQGTVMLTKVGGSVGFAQQTLAYDFFPHPTAINSAVGTSRGLYILNRDGIYLFDGVSATHISQEAEGVATWSWWREKRRIFFASIPDGGLPVRGVHVPQLDSIIWFTYANPNPNISTDTPLTTLDVPKLVGLIYNYETKALSTLEAPNGVFLIPMYGAVPGLAEYVPATGVLSLYAFDSEATTIRNTTVPTLSVDWQSGYFALENSKAWFMLKRLFLQYSGKALDTLTVELHALADEASTPTIQSLGSLSNFSATHWKDARMSGRFVQIVLRGVTGSGQPGTLKGVGMNAVQTGARW